MYLQYFLNRQVCLYRWNRTVSSIALTRRQYCFRSSLPRVSELIIKQDFNISVFNTCYPSIHLKIVSHLSLALNAYNFIAIRFKSFYRLLEQRLGPMKRLTIPGPTLNFSLLTILQQFKRIDEKNFVTKSVYIFLFLY